MLEETNHLEHTQAATDHLQVQAPHLEEEVEVGNLLSHHNLPLHLSDGHYRAIQLLQKCLLLQHHGCLPPGTSPLMTSSNRRS